MIGARARLRIGPLRGAVAGFAIFLVPAFARAACGDYITVHRRSLTDTGTGGTRHAADPARGPA